MFLPARIALCAWNSLPQTVSVTSLNFWFSNSSPRSSGSRHSGTLNCIVLLCPEMFTLSATTLTCEEIIKLEVLVHQTRCARIARSNRCDNRHTKVYTSQNIVSLSSGSSPLASSRRKSLLMNFLKPQSLP